MLHSQATAAAETANTRQPGSPADAGFTLKPRYWHNRLLLVFVVQAMLLAAWREPGALLHNLPGC